MRTLTVVLSVLLTSVAWAAQPGCYNDTTRLMSCKTVAPFVPGQLNGTVTDSASGLVWMRQAGGYVPGRFSDALAWANTQVKQYSFQLLDQSKAGDWRLPTADELVFLATAPAFKTYFKSWQSACYYTGLSVPDDGALAYAVDFAVTPPAVIEVNKSGPGCFAIGVR